MSLGSSVAARTLAFVALSSSCFREDDQGASSAATTLASTEGTDSPATTANADTSTSFATQGSVAGTSDGSTSEVSGDDDPRVVCGDAAVEGDEDCDDGNEIQTDACLSNCTTASCGDGNVQDGVEACDDGLNDGSYNGCEPGCSAAARACGDGVVDPEEQCETGSVLPGTQFVCGAGCVYDFSSVPQLYCTGQCSYAGPAGCDQMDADIYCRLITGDADSTASTYSLLPALAEGGFSCADFGVNLGPMPQLGVPGNVWYQDTSLMANHGGGQAVMNVVCR